MAMRPLRPPVALLIFALCVAGCAGARSSQPASPSGGTATSVWVYPGADGRLVYKQDARGNHIPDFSNAGYGGGGVALPRVPVRLTLQPRSDGGDDGPRIQAALDQLATLPRDAAGFRGALLLKRGLYRIAGSITLASSGVVLRGEGQGQDGTILLATGTSQRALVVARGQGSFEEVAGTRRSITDDYVPVGSRSFHVADAAGFKVGDSIIVQRPSTQEWIDLLGMDACTDRGTSFDTSDEDGRTCLANPWRPGSKDLRFDRIITAIADDGTITVDAPLVNALERQFGGGLIYKYTLQGRLGQVGVENLRGDSEFASPTDEKHGWTFIQLAVVMNGWVRDITAVHFGYAAVHVTARSKWVTVQDSTCSDPVSQVTGGRRYSFNVDDSQMVLFQRCRSSEGRHSYVEGSNVPGPNVFLASNETHGRADIGPHHRWSAGGLYDGIVTDHEINVRNRGNSGTGHGWAGSNMVIWNATARAMRVDNPPAAQNWAIGCTTSPSGNGTFDSTGKPVWPRSLYLTQLRERLGAASVAAIGN
jgi:hypothetical protein